MDWNIWSVNIKKIFLYLPEWDKVQSYTLWLIVIIDLRILNTFFTDMYILYIAEVNGYEVLYQLFYDILKRNFWN